MRLMMMVLEFVFLSGLGWSWCWARRIHHVDGVRKRSSVGWLCRECESGQGRAAAHLGTMSRESRHPP